MLSLVNVNLLREHVNLTDHAVLEARTTPGGAQCGQRTVQALSATSAQVLACFALGWTNV
jgi:hypothetical protein